MRAGPVGLWACEGTLCPRPRHVTTCTMQPCTSAGAISFWNAEERHLEEDSKTHRSPLTSMTWNESGDKLFTTDENAKVWGGCRRSGGWLGGRVWLMGDG